MIAPLGSVTDHADTGLLLTPNEVQSRPRLLRSLLQDRTAVLGLVIVATLSVMVILAPLLSPHDPNVQDVANRFAPPSRDFPFGTDHLGRDVLSRLLFGGRLSIGTAVAVTAAISAIGLVLGMLAGYCAGILDTIISRLIEVVQTVPGFLLALAITAVLGTGLRNVAIAIVVTSWATYARVVRGAVLAERGKDYVESARAVGVSTTRLFRRHLLPNILGPVLVITTLELGVILLAVSGLSFLGLGVKPPAAEWGAMLSEGRTYLGRAPQMMFYPGAAIFLMVLGFNLLGDGLRDVLDPRTREGRR